MSDQITSTNQQLVKLGGIFCLFIQSLIKKKYPMADVFSFIKGVTMRGILIYPALPKIYGFISIIEN